MLLVRYSRAVDGQHGATLGALLIAATLIMVAFIVRALAADVEKDVMKDERQASSDDIGVEMGSLPSAAENAQAEPREETDGPSPEGIGEDATIVVHPSENGSILGALSVLCSGEQRAVAAGGHDDSNRPIARGARHCRCRAAARGERAVAQGERRAAARCSRASIEVGHRSRGYFYAFEQYNFCSISWCGCVCVHVCVWLCV